MMGGESRLKLPKVGRCHGGATEGLNFSCHQQDSRIWDYPVKRVHWNPERGLVFIERALVVVTKGWTPVKNRLQS